MTAPKLDDQAADKPTPLQMAQNCVRAVLDIAEWQDRDPLGARIHHSGTHGKESAELGACMALVSIAESLAEISEVLQADALFRALEDEAAEELAEDELAAEDES